VDKVKTIIKFFYYLLPKVIRDQYGDSIHFYSLLFKKNIKRWSEKTFVSTVELVEDINQLNCPVEVLLEEKNRVSMIDKPKLYKNEKYIYRKELEGEVPDINVYALTNISVVGWTDALICEGKMHHNELSHMTNIHDLKRHDIFTKMKKQENGYRLLVTADEDESDTTYISLLKEHSINYYHWITEGLPRLITIIEAIKKSKYADIKDCTILIDNGMPSQCIEAMQMLLPKDIGIKQVKKGSQLKCKKLIYCTPLWLALDNTKHLPNPKKEFFVDKYALKIVRESILKQLDSKNSTILKNKKIYLQRANTKLRAMTNILEVEDLLYKHDFDFVDTGGLSFSEQLSLFSQADIVVGASGASFTNILFMKEGSTAISFYPSAQSTNYYVFQPLADKSKIDFIHFLTNPEGNSNSVHEDASINVEQLNILLKEIDKCQSI